MLDSLGVGWLAITIVSIAIVVGAAVGATIYAHEYRGVNASAKLRTLIACVSIGSLMLGFLSSVIVVLLSSFGVGRGGAVVSVEPKDTYTTVTGAPIIDDGGVSIGVIGEDGKPSTVFCRSSDTSVVVGDGFKLETFTSTTTYKNPVLILGKEWWEQTCIVTVTQDFMDSQWVEQ